MALSIHFIEYYLIINFDNQPALDYVVWSMGTRLAVGFIVAWAVDLCFVWRIWKLSKQSLICIFLAALATSRTAVGLVNCVIVSFRYTYVPEFLVMVFPTMVAGWALAAFADSLIAIVLCYYLHKHRSGMKRIHHIINRLLLYTVNTGALTSVFAITTMILVPLTTGFFGLRRVCPGTK
ncbi:hypothetical protein BS17DRAFT_790482 [Gyrodon lividus]|nr:hypothetical protein BS17DRAFT_790482 [Gyrodon lividus]